MTDKEICFIINPRSGLVHRENKYGVINDIIDFFSEKEIPITIKTTAKPGDGKRLAEKAVKMGYTHIIACGGDGTINEVVNGLVGSDATLGVLPLGTVNVLAKAVNIPLDDIKEACRHFLIAREKRWDVGVANGRHFLILCGTGLDAEVISQMGKDSSLKEDFGIFGFIVKGANVILGEDGNTNFQTKIKFLDKNEEFNCEAMFILVGNMPDYGADLKLALRAKPNDGKLDIIIFPPQSDDINFVDILIDVFFQEHLNRGDIHYFTSKEFEIITDPLVYCQVDGEELGKTPVSYSIKPGALKVKF